MSKNNDSNNLKINRLKVILTELGISQVELAERLGKNKNTISRICSNKTQPSLEFLWQISIELDVDIKDLLNSSKPSTK